MPQPLNRRVVHVERPIPPGAIDPADAVVEFPCGGPLRLALLVSSQLGGDLLFESFRLV